MTKKELFKFIKAAAVCVLSCISIAILTALLLRTPLFSNLGAFLYRLLALDILCCVVLLVVVYLIIRNNQTLLGLDFFSLVMCIGLSTLFMALFFSLGPMTIERSYTIYSLADMADHAEVMYSAEEIKAQFIMGYIERANACQKRIDEQVAIGNLEEIDGDYRISPKGERLVGLFRLVEAVFPVPDESSIYPNGH